MPEPDKSQQQTTEVVTTSVAQTKLMPNTPIETSIVIDPSMAVLVIKPDNVEEMPKVIQLL